MKKLILSAICLIATILATAQTPVLQWAENMGGLSGNVFGNSITTDNAGNVYTTGGFSGTIDFDPGAGTLNLVSAGSNDVFISKTSASGTLVWIKQLVGASSQSGNSITLDGTGNIIVTGEFSGTMDSDPGVGTFNLTSAGNVDVFITKLDASGNLVWAKQCGSFFGEYGKAVKTDAAGNVYVSGYFGGTTDFDPGAGIFYLGNAGGDDAFFLKLDPAGNFVWAKKIGGVSGEQAYSLAIDGSGNIFSTGYFQGTCDFDPGAAVFNITSSAVQDQFVVKLDAGGNFLWAKNSGGTSHTIGQSVSVDGTGNVYSTGFFSGTTDFDPGAATFNLTSAGSDDIFISKLNASGNFLWAVRMGSTGIDRGLAVIADGSGNVYSTGYFNNTVDFNPGAGISNLNGSLSTTFFSVLDASGNFVIAKAAGGSGTDQGNAIALDASGNILTTGIFQKIADFDPGAGVFNLIALGGNWSVFICKLNSTGIFTWALGAGTSTNTLSTSLAVDGSGNIYAIGNFCGATDFDPGPGTYILTSPLTDTWGNFYITKLDPSGNFLWARQVGGTSGDYANAIAVDASGNVFVTGSFSTIVDFDPGPGIFNLTPIGNEDIFILKLNSLGNFVWAKNAGSTSTDAGKGITLDGSGNIYVPGHFASPVISIRVQGYLT